MVESVYVTALLAFQVELWQVIRVPNQVFYFRNPRAVHERLTANILNIHTYTYPVVFARKTCDVN